MLQTQVNYWDLQERKRSNLANEAILWAQTEENRRHNLAVESVNQQSLEETKRHALVSESQNKTNLSLQKSSLKETRRSNKKRESIQTKQIIESRRHSKAQESIGRVSNEIGYANVALGYSQLGEAVRSHKASESNVAYSNWTDRFLGTQRVANESTANQIRRTENQIKQNQLDWEKELKSEYEYPMREKQLFQGYVGYATDLIQSALSLYGFAKKGGK